MDVTYKGYCKVNQISKGTIYFKIYHCNVRGLRKKACDLLSHFHPDFPHVLCLTEHHLKYPQLNNVPIKNYNLRTYYYRQLHEEGAVAIFVLNSLCVSNIDIVKHCDGQYIKICALKFHLVFYTYVYLHFIECHLVIVAALYLNQTLFFNYYTLLLYTSLCVRT
jgi:hypothetical protein